jgi:inorganic pyrophosphatase
MTSFKKFLGKRVTVTIDRPLGSRHPQWDLVYPINYGFIDGVEAPDNEYLDAYVLGVDYPLEEYKGKCIAIIHRTNDNDDKLVVVPENTSFSDERIRELTEFQEKFFTSIIIRE